MFSEQKTGRPLTARFKENVAVGQTIPHRVVRYNRNYSRIVLLEWLPWERGTEIARPLLSACIYAAQGT